MPKPDTKQDQLIRLLLDTISGTVREGSDLTLRQLAVLLNSYMEPGPHTVRGLAARLNVNKPAITRAIDRLEYWKYAKRRVQVLDRRSIEVLLTKEGIAHIKSMNQFIKDSAKEHGVDPKAPG